MFLSCIPISAQVSDIDAHVTNEIHNTLSQDKIKESGNINSKEIDTQQSKYMMPGYSIRDKDQNRISDFLDDEITRGPVKLPVIVLYDTELSEWHIQTLKELDVEILTIYWDVDMVALSYVPIQIINVISILPDVFRVENYGSPVLYSDIATPAVKARESTLYSPFTAWELGYTGSGSNIAIVDTGIDNGHPSLAGKWLGGVDLSKPETFLTPRDGTFDADDTNGHGTTCSGIATGTGAPDKVYMGAAPDAKLVDVRIGTMIGYAPGELLQSYYDASLEGIQWVMDHQNDQWPGASKDDQGIDVLSLSWGIDVGGSSDGSDPYSRLLDRAVESGVIVVHAAGNSGPSNDGFDGFAAASNGISVAASDDLDTLSRDDDIIAEYSSRGPRHDNGDDNPYNELKPDVTAPGTHIMQAQFDVFGDGSGNGYGNRGSGTSYATPVVAGIVAMMLQANPDLTPTLTKEILHLTSERRGEPSVPDLDPFWNNDFGWGIVDAYKAVKVSEKISNIDLINVNLQCFIIDIEGISENITSGTVNINGLAFSKNGEEIEKIELSIDNGSWKTIDKFEADGIYNRWKYELNTKGLSNGNHTINVRAVSGAPYSLTHFVEITVENEGGTVDEISAGQFSTIIVALLVIGTAILVYLYIKKRKYKEIEN
jgi:serine protease AprX